MASRHDEDGEDDKGAMVHASHGLERTLVRGSRFGTASVQQGQKQLAKTKTHPFKLK